MRRVQSALGLVYLCMLALTSIGLQASEHNSECSTPVVVTVFEKSVLEVLPKSVTGCTVTMGYHWLEGPVWSNKDACLYFSDIPSHRVLRYCPTRGTDVYLAQSGYSNGLIFDHQGRLVLMQSRSRKVARLSKQTSKVKVDYEILADRFKDKRLNSPNDVALSANGTIYFTDPPYGLAKQLEDPTKELSFQGVYKLTSELELSVMDDSLDYPNGITLIDSGTAALVAASNPSNPAWYRYKVDANGDLVERTVFADARDVRLPRYHHGLPDGLKEHSSGLIFATGPGGVWVLSKNGKLQAHIKIDRPVANLAFNQNEKLLFLTAQDRLIMMHLK